MKTATTIIDAVLPDDSGWGYIDTAGRSNAKMSKVKIVQCWPKAVDQSDRRKQIEFWNVAPKAIRELRKALQTRESELVKMKYLEEE